MKVEQFAYLSPEAQRLRKRDRIPPWSVHPCEVDSLGTAQPDGSIFYLAWQQASSIRNELEKRYEN